MQDMRVAEQMMGRRFQHVIYFREDSVFFQPQVADYKYPQP
jgi:hypothetical protein